jgi:DNA-binding XRE family transcriptional regulator
MKTTTPEIINKLAAIRKKRGLSASTLAASVGVSRQTIYAIEAGAYVPNTAIGLRLAQALGTPIEDLFSLPEESLAPKARLKKAILLPLSDSPVTGQPVRLCKVNGKLVAAAPSPWYLPPADGAIGGKEEVEVYQPEEYF